MTSFLSAARGLAATRSGIGCNTLGDLLQPVRGLAATRSGRVRTHTRGVRGYAGFRNTFSYAHLSFALSHVRLKLIEVSLSPASVRAMRLLSISFLHTYFMRQRRGGELMIKYCEGPVPTHFLMRHKGGSLMKKCCDSCVHTPDFPECANLTYRLWGEGYGVVYTCKNYLHSKDVTQDSAMW